MKEAANEPGLSSPTGFFGGNSSHLGILDNPRPEVSWVGCVWGVGVSEGPLGDTLGYGAGRINWLVWPQPLFAHGLVVRGTSRRQDEIVGARTGFRRARIPPASY